VTIAKRPSVSGRDGDNEQVSWVKSEAEYFLIQGWTCDSLFSLFVIPGCAAWRRPQMCNCTSGNPYALWRRSGT
jgi:hypothetical protein